MSKGDLFNSIIWLQAEQQSHERSIYGWIDLLGDLGGVTEVIMICFGFFLFPISEHSYILKASKKLFFARTKDSAMFLSDQEKKKHELP